MLATSNKNVEVWNWGIPALLTCRQAGACAGGCYARQGFYNMPVVKNAYNDRLELAKGPRGQFTRAIMADIDHAIRKAGGKRVYIRIHDSGDFFSLNYALSWLEIIEAYPKVKFYAYTKEVRMFKDWKLPRNFRVVFSYGGKQDELIEKGMAHSRVFETSADIKKAGYIDASDNDLMIFKGKKIGLAYHGQKAFNKTRWRKEQ